MKRVGSRKLPTIVSAAALGLLVLFATGTSVCAQTYQIAPGIISSGGGSSSGGPYNVVGTIGQPAQDQSAGGAYAVQSGFFATIVVLQVPGAPSVFLSFGGQSLTLRWMETTSVYGIETADDLQNGGAWRAVTGTPVLTGGTNYVTLSVTRGMQFYRLKKQPPPVPQGNGVIYDTDHVTPIGNNFKGQIYTGMQANGSDMLPRGPSGVFFNGGLFVNPEFATPVPGFAPNQIIYVQIKAWESSQAATFEGLPIFNRGKTAITQIFSVINSSSPSFPGTFTAGFPNTAVTESQ